MMPQMKCRNMRHFIRVCIVVKVKTIFGYIKNIKICDPIPIQMSVLIKRYVVGPFQSGYLQTGILAKSEDPE